MLENWENKKMDSVELIKELEAALIGVMCVVTMSIIHEPQDLFPQEWRDACTTLKHVEDFLNEDHS